MGKKRQPCGCQWRKPKFNGLRYFFVFMSQAFSHLSFKYSLNVVQDNIISNNLKSYISV
jgi:hypothetical protein